MSGSGDGPTGPDLGQGIAADELKDGALLAGHIGGDAVRVYDLKRLTGRASPGFAATFLDRFIGLFTLIGFSVVAFAADPTLWSAGVTLPIAVLVAVLAGVLCFGFSRLGRGHRLSPGRADRAVRQSGAAGRHPQALGRRLETVRARGQGGGVLLAGRPRRAHRRSRRRGRRDSR